MKESAAFSWEDRTEHSANFLRQVYQLHNKPDNLYSVSHDGAYVYHIPSILTFFDQYF